MNQQPTQLISETFQRPTGSQVTIHQLPAIIDPKTSEVVGFSVGVSSAIDQLLEHAQAQHLSEIQFDPALIPPQEAPDPVSRELRRAMLARGMTGAAIARALGVKPPLVSRWLSSSYHDHSMDTIRRIADVLDMDVEVTLKPRAS